MKRLTTIFGGIILMVITCVMLFLASAIYDSGEKVVVEPYFFQPNNLSSQRVGRPTPPNELGDGYIRDALLRRFVTEYFYVLPDAENIARRMTPGAKNSLYHLSTDDVFNAWATNVAPEIQEMAKENQLRLVRFSNNPNTPDIIQDPTNGYWQIFYQLHTWDTPNDLNTAPTVTNHTMFIKFETRDGISPGALADGVHKYLDTGGDPVGLFRLKVTDVILK